MLAWPFISHIPLDYLQSPVSSFWIRHGSILAILLLEIPVWILEFFMFIDPNVSLASCPGLRPADWEVTRASLHVPHKLFLNSFLFNQPQKPSITQGPHSEEKCEWQSTELFFLLGGISVYRRCIELIQTDVSCPSKKYEEDFQEA